MSGLPTDQVLAIIRLREWARDRVMLKSGKVTRYDRPGRPPKHRDTNRINVTLVRVCDFELAFSRLTVQEQTALASIYRDGQSHSEAAKACACSHRQMSFLLPAARQHLADILDRRDLL